MMRTETSSSPSESNEVRSDSAATAASGPPNGPCASTSAVCGSTMSTTYPSQSSRAATRSIQSLADGLGFRTVPLPAAVPDHGVACEPIAHDGSLSSLYYTE